MKDIKIESVFTVYNSVDELPTAIISLMQQAVEARKSSYAPYSKFSVGAAILMNNGEVVIGSNQENASYPSGLCAERTAIFYAGAQYPNELIKAMAITAGAHDDLNENPIPPCGACRQSISEYEVKQKKPIEIYFMGVTGKIVRAASLSELLPLAFDRSMLR